MDWPENDLVSPFLIFSRNLEIQAVILVDYEFS